MSFDPLSAALDLGSKILDKIFPDPAQRDAAKLKLFEMQQTGELAILAADTDLAKAQIAVNEVEAASTSLFVAGWRPFIGWVCGVAFAYHFIVQPLVAFGMSVRCSTLDKCVEIVLPTFDMTALFTVLGGMLGIGGMRTLEKIKGVTK